MKWNLTNKWLKLNEPFMVIHGMRHPLWRRKLPEVWGRGILMGISRLVSDQLTIMCSVIYWAYMEIHYPGCCRTNPYHIGDVSTCNVSASLSKQT